MRFIRLGSYTINADHMVAIIWATKKMVGLAYFCD